jgi:hypothetical protein
MEEIIKIESSSNRPEVIFNAKTGQLYITGRSIVENAIRFYEPLSDWIKEYCQNPAEKTELHLKLEYFNTSTSKYLLSFIEMLEEIFLEGKDVEVFWYSVDEDMLELGEDYAAMIEIPFQFLEYSL